MGKLNWRIVVIGAAASVALIGLYYGVKWTWRSIGANPGYARVAKAATGYNKLKTIKNPVEITIGDEDQYFRMAVPDDLLSDEDRKFWKDAVLARAEERKDKSAIDQVNRIVVLGDRHKLTSVIVVFDGKRGKEEGEFAISLPYGEDQASSEVWLQGWADYFNGKVRKETPPLVKTPSPAKLKSLPPPPK